MDSTALIASVADITTYSADSLTLQVMNSHSPDPTPLTEDDAHRVLARAVELDVRAATEISIAQLQRIADEAGIGADSLDRALQEWRAGHLSSPSRASGLALAEQLRRFRGHALLVSFIGAAFLTSGDVFATNLAYVLPVMAVYELVLLVARRQSSSGPPSSRRAAQPTESAHSSDRPHDRTLRIDALALRVRSIAPAR